MSTIILLFYRLSYWYSDVNLDVPFTAYIANGIFCMSLRAAHIHDDVNVTVIFFYLFGVIAFSGFH